MQYTVITKSTLYKCFMSEISRCFTVFFIFLFFLPKGINAQVYHGTRICIKIIIPFLWVLCWSDYTVYVTDARKLLIELLPTQIYMSRWVVPIFYLVFLLSRYIRKCVLCRIYITLVELFIICPCCTVLGMIKPILKSPSNSKQR